MLLVPLGIILFIVGTFLYMYPATINLGKFDAISAAYYDSKWGIWFKIGGVAYGLLELCFIYLLVNHLGYEKYQVVLIPFSIASLGLVSLSYVTAGRNKLAHFLHLPLVICYCFFTAIGAGLLGIGLANEYPLFALIDFIIIGFYTFYLPISIWYTREVYWAAYMHGVIHYPWYLALFAIVLR